jgi:hypothetical protein
MMSAQGQFEALQECPVFTALRLMARVLTEAFLLLFNCRFVQLIRKKTFSLQCRMQGKSKSLMVEALSLAKQSRTFLCR